MNLEQTRARNAFEAADTVARQDASDFLGWARTLPAMLQTNGLLATWAYLLAKGKSNEGSTEHTILKYLLDHLRCCRLEGLGEETQDFREVFLNVWVASDSTLTGTQLRRLTAEAIRFSVWLKRAAEALCDTGKAAGGGDSHEP